MTTVLTSNDGESAENKMEKIVLDGGELLSSSLPQLDVSVKSSPILKTPRDNESTSELPASNQQSARAAAGAAASKRAEAAGKSPRVKSALCRPTSSSIPLPINKNTRLLHSPTKTLPSHNNMRSASCKITRPSSGTHKTTVSAVTNKHTLEVQFMNKKKRLGALHKELIEKQKPILDLYHNLVQIKKKLEELGKIVTLEEIKIVPLVEGQPIPSTIESTPDGEGSGESIPTEVVIGMQTSIEEIPNTLMDICKNLLARRNIIVELLESIIKSEVNVNDLSDHIETLKVEGAQLQSNLDVVINEHHNKIKEIVRNWHILLNEKKTTCSIATEDLEEKLKSQEKLYEESKQAIQDLQKKLDDKRSGHERYVNELNNVITGLKEQILKLEQDLETERKTTAEYKSRNNSNAQVTKTVRNKYAELENEKKALDTVNADLNKKIKHLQEQLKHKESQWNKEKEEITKNMKHQEHMMQKLASEKSSFETRLSETKDEKCSVEECLKEQISALETQLKNLQEDYEQIVKERDEAQHRCKEISDHLSSLAREDREAMDMLTNSIDWGKDNPTSKADVYSENMMKDIIIQECKDKIKQLEEENNAQREAIMILNQNEKKYPPSDTEKKVLVQHDVVVKYKQLLAESELKLNEKSHEIAKLTSEIRQLKVRQEHLEELNQKCPTENLQKMVEEGRNKLSELMKKSLESEQKILHCENIIDKQTKQMNEMENMLRYRENITNVLKSSRDELVIEKESLSRYSHEMRMVLAEITKEGKMKDRLITELQEKVEGREKHIHKLEKELQNLEHNLVMTNEKRYKLQETVGNMEKELQCTKAQVSHLADTNSRYDLVMNHSSSSNNINSSCSSVKNTCLIVEEPNRTNAVVKLEELSCSGENQISCKTLIGQSLRQIDYLKSRLNHLTNISVPLKKKSHHRLKNIPQESDLYNEHCRLTKVSSSTNLAEYHGRHKNLSKIVELTAKRYEYLQQQAYDSYEELTKLIKMAVSSQKIPAC